MNRICSICARGGSKGVPNKNLAIIKNKPLIAHTIEQAKKTDLFKEISVSSDSDEILDISEKWGASFFVKRPIKLATSESAKLPAIQHNVKEVEKSKNKRFDTIVDLDATSPLREPSDIIKAVNLLEKSEKGKNLISGCVSRRSPYFNLVELNEDGFVELSKKLENRIVRRQDSPKCFDMNASIYIWKRDVFFKVDEILLKNTIMFEMPEEKSVDIDTKFDLNIVNFLFEQGQYDL